MSSILSKLAKIAGFSSKSFLVEENANLQEINQTLRSKALALSARADNLERYCHAVRIGYGGAFWRHYALSYELWGEPGGTVLPPQTIPDELLSRFTMNDQAEIVENYIDATYPGNWPVIYSEYQIEQFMEQIDRREYFIYGMTDVWVWEAIEKYPIKDLDVVNMGSLTPWYETNCLYFEARPTTIDYNPIISQTPRIKTMTVDEWERDRPQFDIAWSISSFEHDGLGMYGDPIDPDGDLKAMQKMKEIVNPGGLLFLAVPVGKDKILFNNARIYGRVRLPLLINGWEKIDSYGFYDEQLDGLGHVQPVLVLKNT